MTPRQSPEVGYDVFWSIFCYDEFFRFFFLSLRVRGGLMCRRCVCVRACGCACVVAYTKQETGAPHACHIMSNDTICTPLYVELI